MIVRKETPKIDDTKQFKRFVEMAEGIKADDADERFEEAVGKMLKARPAEQTKRKGQKA